MESYSVEAILSAVDKNFSSTMKSADSSMNSLDSSTRKTNTSILDVAKGIGVFKLVDSAIGVVKNSVDGAIDRFDTLNKYPVVMQALGYSADQVDNSMSKLNKGIDGLPTSLNEIVSNTQQLAISTGDLDKGTDTAIALNNAFLASGASTADASRGMQQYVQMLSKGTVDMQSWRSIQETMPIAMDKVAKSFKDQGVNSVNELYDALQGGTVTFEDFNNRLIKLNEGVGGFAELAKKNSAGIRTSFSNIKTAVVKGLANIMTAIDEGMQGAGLGTIAENFDKIKDAVNTAFKVIAENIPPAIDFLTQLWESLKKGLDGFDVTGFAKIFEIIANVAKVAFGAILAVLPTVVEWVGKLATFFSKVVTAIQPFLPALLPIIGAWASFMVHLKGVSTAIRLFNSLKTVVTGVTTTFKILTAVMAANPFVIIVGAIVGLVAAFIYLWNTSEEFRNFWIGLWEGIKKAVGSAVDWIVSAWDGMKEFFSNAWDGLVDGVKQAINAVKQAWRDTKRWFADLWNGIKNMAVETWNGIKQTISNAVDGVVSAWQGVKQWFADLWKGIKSTITSIVNSIKEAIMNRFGALIYGVQDAFAHMGIFLSTLWENICNIAAQTFEILKNIILAPILFVTSMISGGWEETKNNMIAIWNNILEAGSSIWTSIKAIFDSFLINTKMAFLSVWNGIQATLIYIWTTIQTIAIDTFNSIVAFFVETWENIKQGAVDAWNGLKIWLSETWESMKQGAISIWNSVKQFFIDLWESIKTNTINMWNAINDGIVTAWENTKNAVINTAKSIVDGAAQAWEDMKAGVSNAVDRVKETFDTIRQIDLLQIGKDIIDGLINGITSKINAVKKAVKGVADSITGKIKDILNIHSPSRVMAQLGVFTSQGLAEGMIDGTKYVDKASETLADRVSNMDVGSRLSNINGQIQTQVQHEVSYGTTNQPAQFNVRLGNREFSAFVEDISQAQGNEINLNMQF